MPAVSTLGHPLRVFVLHRDGGPEVDVVLADSQQVLLDAQKAITTTELLPGEDPALLHGPDRIELYPVIDVHEVNLAGASAQ